MRLIAWVPNILTISRFVGLVIATVFLFKGGQTNTMIAFALYFLVAVTDVIDGYIARRFNAITAFGKILDPIADKAYILTLYFSFAILNLISIWWVVPIFLREAGVTVFRMILVRNNRVVAAEKSGKMKALAQNISLFFLFLLFLNVHFWKSENGILNITIVFFAYIFLILAVALTLFSGFEFFRKNLKDWAKEVKQEMEPS